MLSENAPNCACGAHDWQVGGRSFGGISQSWFTCRKCQREAQELFAYGQNYFIVPTEVGFDISVENTYFNDVLLVTCRARGAQQENARDNEAETAWRDFCEQNGLAVDTKFDDMPKSHPKHEEVEQFWRSLHKRFEYRVPAGFEQSPIPPKLPRSLTVYRGISQKEGNQWELVNHDEADKLNVPSDPIRVQHDDYYGSFFAALAEKMNVTLDRKEVPNQYCGHKSQPWYEFVIGDLTFTVGPRKRVTAIKVNAPSGLATAKIRTAAQADEVTYEAYDAEGSGGWEDKLDPAVAIEVHAWNTDQLEKYLTILITEATQSVQV